MYERIKTEYLCYLMNRVGLEAEGPDGYIRLCETLQSIEFCPIVGMDENRCSECLEIRKDFAQDNDLEGADEELDRIYGDNGTMMELLTVMAEKIYFEMCDSQLEASTRKWFLEMLINCGLDRYCTNADFEEEGAEETVTDAIHSVIFRKTGWDGEGGFFPLLYPQADQRNIELMIQMNNYLAENYDIC